MIEHDLTLLQGANWQEKAVFFGRLATLLDLMRKLGFEHRDLYEDNVLVRNIYGELYPCLIDFGQSKIGAQEGDETWDGNDDESFKNLCREFDWP